MLPFGPKSDQKSGFRDSHLTKNLYQHRNEDLSNSSHFRVTVGKVLSRHTNVSVGLCYFPMSKPGWGNIFGRHIPGFESSYRKI